MAFADSLAGALRAQQSSILFILFLREFPPKQKTGLFGSWRSIFLINTLRHYFSAVLNTRDGKECFDELSKGHILFLEDWV